MLHRGVVLLHRLVLSLLILALLGHVSGDGENAVAREGTNYMIFASRVLRPNTFYKVVVILLDDSQPATVIASISANGVSVANNRLSSPIKASESREILLRIPPDNSDGRAKYLLRVEGQHSGGSGGTIFEHERELEFAREFLSIFISTNKVIYNAEHPVRIRVIMLTTSLEPYNGIVDLFVLDPDGYVMRKWNSKELNVGVITETFVLPLYPKVGFWTIRVRAESQVEELRIKVEKFYLPKFELVVSQPAFALDTDESIEASVEGAFITERIAKGNVRVVWYAKKIDYQTPMYNDSVLYRQEYDYQRQIANIYRNNLYQQVSSGNESSRSSSPRPTFSTFIEDPFRDTLANRSSVSGAPATPIVQSWTKIRESVQYFRVFQPVEPFRLYLEEIESVMGQTDGIQVRCSAELVEVFYNETQTAFGETRIIGQKLHLKFLGSRPYVFKPGMTFQGQLAILYNNLVPLEEDVLQSSSLLLKSYILLEDGNTEELSEILIPASSEDDPEYEVEDEDSLLTSSINSMIRQATFKDFRESGIHAFKLEIPPNAVQLKIKATFSNEDIGSADAELVAYAAYSKSGQAFLKVSSNTKEVSVGSYVVFHAKSSFPMAYLDWIIVSKDVIVTTGRELAGNIHPEIVTFSVVVSSEMAPGFRVLVHSLSGVELVSDSLFVPVEAIDRQPIQFATNQVKDHQKLSVELTCRGDPGAVFMLATMRESLFAAQGGNTVTKANLLRNLYRLEGRESLLHSVYKTSREGDKPDDIKYFQSSGSEADTKRFLAVQNLLFFSNTIEATLAPEAASCNETDGETPCLTRGCFTRDQRCDGKPDCEDGYDERGCRDHVSEALKQMQSYRLSRQSRFEDFYDIGDGDWAWLDTNMDEDGEQFFTVPIPETPDDFYFHVFSVSKSRGIGLLHTPISYSTTRPIDFYCEAPEFVHRGESLSVRCNLINRSPYELEFVVILKASELYEFIHVEEYGYVVSHSPRTSNGEHHHFLWLRPETETEVYTPIKPKLEQGTLDIDLELSTQMTVVYQSVSVTILPEGSTVHRHTSALLDLKNRANVLTFMNIIVDETPIVPYEVFRRFVAGSPRATVTISGDVIGPIFPGDEPVSLESMFPTGNGRFGKGTEYHAFNLAANTLQLHYLRLTNQLGEYRELAKTVFEFMNVEYMAVMRRFTANGSFSNWDDSPPSVWLTAWVIRIFGQVSFQDWEDFIYIDPMAVSSAVLWLLNYQASNGAFYETSAYREQPLHHGMKKFMADEEDFSSQVPLTAHVLVSLEETASMLQGKSKQFASTARSRAVSYLERNIKHITDGYELTLVVYALALAKSSMADLAYGMLLTAAREDGGMVYWGRTDIRPNRVRYEFNRPFLEAKDYQDNDALAVEATGYALQTMFLIEGGGITFTQEKVVQWLNTMRLGNGGFIATVDTAVALKALVLYSYHSRIRDITDLTVDVDLPDSNYTESFHITPTSIAQGQTIDVPNVWGHLNLYAVGAGQALAQLDVNYGIDFSPYADQPARDCFQLKIKEEFHGRNKSEVTVNSCFSWTLTEESETSGFALLAIDTPTGYVIEQPEANRIVRSGVVPEMRDADVTRPGHTIWYFDRVPNETRCFRHTVRRYFPVANLTRTRQAVLVEPLRPERFMVRTFNATPLYILSVCEVCGSYQCPYCPFYSSAEADHQMWPFVGLLVALVLCIK